VTNVPSLRTAGISDSVVLPPTVQRNVDVADDVGDVLVGVVDELICAEAEHEVAAARGSSADHPGSRVLCELHREVTDAASGACNEHGLPLLEPASVEQSVPCGHCGAGSAAACS
jgi:hypothetical protein